MKRTGATGPVRTREVFDGARKVEYEPDDDLYLVFYADGTAKAWAETSYGWFRQTPIPTTRPSTE